MDQHLCLTIYFWFSQRKWSDFWIHGWIYNGFAVEQATVFTTTFILVHWSTTYSARLSNRYCPESLPATRWLSKSYRFRFLPSRIFENWSRVFSRNAPILHFCHFQNQMIPPVSFLAIVQPELLDFECKRV